MTINLDANRHQRGRQLLFESPYRWAPAVGRSDAHALALPAAACKAMWRLVTAANTNNCPKRGTRNGFLSLRATTKSVTLRRRAGNG